MTDTLYCTIDTSGAGELDRDRIHPRAIRKAIEDAMRTIEGQDKWRCAAVIGSARNTERIRIACRNEAELQRVKEAARKTAAEGVRVLRDQVHPVKVDNVNNTAVIDPEGKVMPGAAAVLRKENEVDIAKIWWLSSTRFGESIRIDGGLSDEGKRCQTASSGPVFPCRRGIW